MRRESFGKLLLSLVGAVRFGRKRNRAFLSISSRSLHELQKHGHVSDASIYASNRNIDYLMKSGKMASAVSLFDEMPDRDVITWNIMISGLCRNGYPRESLSMYSQMICQGFVENPSTFSVVLSISCSEGLLYRERTVIHCRSIVLGFTTNVYITSAIVDLYFRMGLYVVALRLFRTSEQRNLATWNIVLRNLAEIGRSQELLTLYSDMKRDEIGPNGVTFCYILRGCGSEKLLDEGTQLHCCVIKKGHADSNLFIANALVDFYSACGNLSEAWRSFELIPLMKVISWNSMVSVLAVSGFAVEALELYNRMHQFDKRPSLNSFNGLLKSSGSAKDTELGRQVHCCVIKLGFLHNPMIESSLIDMYGRCGDTGGSFSIFNSMNQRSMICCNALMASLLRAGFLRDVFELFGLMVDENIGFDEITLSLALKALSCTTILHCCALKSGLESHIAVASSLIDAYSKSGEISLSKLIFNDLSSPNVVCITSMISALARNGDGRQCIDLLNSMTASGLTPDSVTYLNVLTGCNHSGMVEEGRSVFQMMQTQHGLKPDRRHYSCMVDLLGRAGFVGEAVELLEGSSLGEDAVIWGSVLRSCRVYREEIGRRVAEKMVDLEPERGFVWREASGFYAAVGDSEMARFCREMAAAREISGEIFCGRSCVGV